MKKKKWIIIVVAVIIVFAIIKTSKLSNYILHQFEGLHKLWDTPFLAGKYLTFYLRI